MFKVEVIGNLGADAQVANQNGNEFIKFNVAHTEKRTAADGSQVENTTWISCTMSIERRVLLPFLLKGKRVFVRGNASLRVYDSAQAHCKMAGVNLRVAEIELCSDKQVASAAAYPAEVHEVDGTLWILAEDGTITPKTF